MKVGIIGGGSVGLLIGSKLAVHHKITIYVRRTEQKASIKKNGIFVDKSDKPVKVNAQLMDYPGKEDIFIVCVKQEHITSVLTFIQHVRSGVPVIFLQNGMGHIDKLLPLELPIMVGVVEHGANRVNDYTVLHTGEGTIKLAGLVGDGVMLSSVADKLHRSGFPFQFSLDWKSLLYEKLIINAVINPLTALFDVRNGMILENRYLKQLACDLCYEASSILNVDFTSAWQQVQYVIRNTSENVSSMLKDIRENRRTEIDMITGYLVENSTENIPNTTFIYRSIKALEMKKGNIE
ncbi:2-dehydropantoate 2-reductase [Virgibacillus siamensis]|uniref:2-dehydropantoate 2-reductase n=1 Tax=Virgibacillus siamensis TaxID=480071 RepID=UPI00158E3376|nr:2-dehydropantoate 2-reductase [Virgibacillus siamensis]